MINMLLVLEVCNGERVRESLFGVCVLDEKTFENEQTDKDMNTSLQFLIFLNFHRRIYHQ